MSKIYLAGRITGDPDYREKFADAAAALEAEGHIVLNPATLPRGMENSEYMAACLPMLMLADEIALLPGWEDSFGARIEKALAEYCGLGLRYFDGYLENEAPTPFRWIPVTERLPEPSWARVLAYTDEGQIQTLPAYKVGNGYVTHWMAIEPPEGTE